MAFDKNKEKGFNSISNNNLSRPSNKCNSKKHVNNPIIKDKDVGGVHSSWSLSADEDYIEFCFGKDVAQDDKSANSETHVKGQNEMHKNSRPVNRKLKYSEDDELISDQNIHDKRSNVNHHQNDLHEEDIVHVGTQQHVEGSAESRNSDQSEGSRSSFAFPVTGLNVVKDWVVLFEKHRLGWEWIGSPVQMPKSEGLHLRKPKARAIASKFTTKN
ncbi:unnamed protein product [Sphenostylis stenocarpa]|uniref:Uncharacterized protein n=1 Tax=Sphenostylis stenocarpa TaxID=92480 RepID=A0AA86SMD1_9FABA|nr:unnamed protein product [Sphenostylis stenocarpa]